VSKWCNKMLCDFIAGYEGNLIPQPQATTPLIHFPIQTIADYLCIQLLACLLTKYSQ